MYTFLHTMYPNKCTFLVLGLNSDTVLLRETTSSIFKYLDVKELTPMLQPEQSEGRVSVLDVNFFKEAFGFKR